MITKSEFFLVLSGLYRKINKRGKQLFMFQGGISSSPGSAFLSVPGPVPCGGDRGHPSHRHTALQQVEPAYHPA
jgi:hypothetical protein